MTIAPFFAEPWGPVLFITVLLFGPIQILIVGGLVFALVIKYFFPPLPDKLKALNAVIFALASTASFTLLGYLASYLTRQFHPDPNSGGLVTGLFIAIATPIFASVLGVIAFFIKVRR